MRFRVPALLLLFVLGAPRLLHSQAMTSITATSIQAGSTPITGTLCFTPINPSGTPISISSSAGRLYLPGQPFCQELVNGALSGSLSVPNSSTDSMPGHAYDVTVYDLDTAQRIDVGPIYGVGGTTWALDTYISPATAPTAQAFTFTYGTGSAPSSCVAPALDTRVNAGVASISVCQSGVFTPVSSGSNAPVLTRIFSSTQTNCTAGYPLYGTGACDVQAVVDDGTGGAGVVGQQNNFQAYGSGLSNAAGTEGRNISAMQWHIPLAIPGIKNILTSFSGCFGVGDCIPLDFYHYGNQGIAYPSDQGYNGIYNHGGQQLSYGSGQPGHLIATLTMASPNGQFPAVNSIHGCTAETQFCLTAPGSSLLDITSGGPSGYLTGVSVPFTGGQSYLFQLPTTGGLPVSTAECVATDIGLDATVQPFESPLNQTITCTLQAIGGATHALSAGDHVDVFGDLWEEQSVVASVSTSGTTQTVTLPLSRPNNNVTLWKGGVAGYALSFDGDLMYGTRTAYPCAGSVDSVNLVCSTPAYGHMNNNGLPQTGTEPETTAGSSDPYSGFHLFRKARITKNISNSPLVFALEPNVGLWPAAGTVEDADFTAQNTIGIWNDVAQTTPSSGNGTLQGVTSSITGMGAAGLAYGINSENTMTATGYYTHGMLEPLCAFCSGQLNGGSLFRYALHTSTAPLNGYLHSYQLQPGQTGVTIFGIDTGVPVYMTYDAINQWIHIGGGNTTSPGTSAIALHVQNSILVEGTVSAENGVNVGYADATFQSYYQGQPLTHFGLKNKSPFVSDDTACLGHGVLSGGYTNVCDGNLELNTVLGPAAIPTIGGACTKLGWDLAPDGHGYFCSATPGTWSQKF